MASFNIIIMEAMFWSFLWVVVIMIFVRVFPFAIAHDYPKDVREVANISKPSKTRKRQSILLGITAFCILIGLLLLFILTHYNNGQEVSFFTIFAHLWIICLFWNIVDLLVVDWLLICLLSFKFLVLPGTENYIGNKNYKYHLVGFLKGCIAMSIMAILVSGLSYLILLLLR